GDGPCLVGLQLADEVDGEPLPHGGRQLGHLGGGLLVLVLPDVGDAEVGQGHDVGHREVLGHHDERDLGGVATRRGAGGGDAVLHGGEVAAQLLDAVGHATSSGGSSRTTPAYRPVVPSRRWE